MMGRFATLLEQVEKGGIEVRADSRQVGPGDVFVAVPGATEDGARFIPAAREATDTSESILFPRFTPRILAMGPSSCVG